MLVTTAPRPVPEAPTAPTRGGHLWQVDVVRLLTFAAVIGVHVIAYTEQPDNRLAGAAMMLLQYGREVFFALTGFVLVYSTMGRPLRLKSFWRRRIMFVAVPYLVWTCIYYFYFVAGPAHMRATVTGFVGDLMYGQAEYHLYFLLVTIQLYLAFPLISRFVARTAHRAVLVLIAVSVVNIAWLAVLAYVDAPPTWPGWLWFHSYELLPSYSMYVLAGCYAAVHLDRIQQAVMTRSRQLLALAGLCAAAAIGFYALQLPFMSPRLANQVLQPAMTFSCVAAVIVVYIIGARWAAGRRRHQRAIEVLSDASFGVYLAHPLVLQLLTDYAGFGNTGQARPPVVATILGYLITAAGATAISLVARRTPLSLALAGRPWREGVKRPAVSRTRSTEPARDGGVAA
jgi:peptidoglycan/LPS O-acetylase OafA/YrhL